MSEAASLKFGEKRIDLPVCTGTEQEQGLDISKLRSSTGLITLDEGYINTGSTTSSITYLDGEQGILRYRGYPIEVLAEHCDFVETSYLLIFGELPTEQVLHAFRMSIGRHTMLHEDMRTFYNGFPRDAHPMAILSSVVSGLSTFYQDSLDTQDEDQIEISVRRLLAKLPTIAAYSHKKSIGQPFNYPQNDHTYVENFLQMMFGVPSEPYEMDPYFVDALNLLLIVHADHEQNCSTTAMRIIGSSHSDPYSALTGAAAALYGPLHGGANEAVLRMLTEIGSIDNVPKIIKSVKSGERKLMGFGHRVYKSYDPRAKIIKRTADLVFSVTKHNPRLDIALELERIALQDDYFVERRLYPNVDFYSGLIYEAMGFQPDMFPVLFAIPRTVGWIAQWEEMLLDTEQKITRPRQLYIGAAPRDYVKREKRS